MENGKSGLRVVFERCRVRGDEYNLQSADATCALPVSSDDLGGNQEGSVRSHWEFVLDCEITDILVDGWEFLDAERDVRLKCEIASHRPGACGHGLIACKLANESIEYVCDVLLGEVWSQFDGVQTSLCLVRQLDVLVKDTASKAAVHRLTMYLDREISTRLLEHNMH